MDTKSKNGERKNTEIIVPKVLRYGDNKQNLTILIIPITLVTLHQHTYTMQTILSIENLKK